MLGDPSAIPALVQLLDGGVNAAVDVPGRPHLTQPYDSVLEALGALQAKAAIPLIQPFTEHPSPKIQYAALRAMYQLTQEDSYGQRLVAGLNSDDLKLRRVVLSDSGAIGYVGAAAAIASCRAENSFKLLSLKGLLESQLQTQPTQLSDPAIHLMSLMDSLL